MDKKNPKPTTNPEELGHVFWKNLRLKQTIRLICIFFVKSQKAFLNHLLKSLVIGLERAEEKTTEKLLCFFRGPASTTSHHWKDKTRLNNSAVKL